MDPDNQTPDEWLTLAAVRDHPNALGTGLFLLFTKLVNKVENLTYDACVRNAVSTQPQAFKWVPNVVESYQEILNTVCAEKCNRRCIKPGCICDTTDHVCRGGKP